MPSNVYNTVLLQSNLLSVSTLSAAIKNGTPARGYFRDVGELLSVPELTVASPYLNRSAPQIKYVLNDEAYEMIPIQLLFRVRPDIVAGIEKSGTNHLFKFSVYPGHNYQIQESTDLKIWTTLTNFTSTEDTLLVPLTIPTSNTNRLYRVLME
jgi:hypothetical protein